jgi:hypothetical protein
LKRPDPISLILHASVYVFLLLAALKVLGLADIPWWAVFAPLSPNAAVLALWVAASISDHRTAPHGERPRGLRIVKGGR